MTQTMTPVVLGQGAWGTALAMMLCRGGFQPTLWGRDPQKSKALQKSQYHPLFPHISLPSSLIFSSDRSVFSKATVLFSVIPARHTVETLTSLSLDPTVPIILCSKGIAASGQRLTEAVRQQKINNPLAVLSGPSFAKDVMENKHTSVVLAADDHDLLQNLSAFFQDPSFCIQPSRDVAGVEWAGVIKNVMALMAGMIIGQEHGENTRAAVLVHLMNEFAAWVVATHHGQHSTFAGLAGWGDTLLSATSLLSRNFSLGKHIAEGKEHHDDNVLSEGQKTAQILEQALNTPSSQDVPLLRITLSILQGEVSLEQGLRKFFQHTRSSS